MSCSWITKGSKFFPLHFPKNRLVGLGKPNTLWDLEAFGNRITKIKLKKKSMLIWKDMIFLIGMVSRNLTH